MGAACHATVCLGLSILDPRILWGAGMLTGALLLGALVIALVDRWRKRQEKATVLSTHDELAQYRALYEQGEMSKEEFEKVKSQVTKRLKAELKHEPVLVKKVVPAEVTPPPPPPEAPAGTP